MPSFNLPNEYIRRISERFKRYRKIRSLIAKNVDSYIADYKNFHGTKEERSEYLETTYRPKAPQENYLAVMAGDIVRFHVKDIAILIGRDQSSASRLLANLERSEGWYSRLAALRHESKSANNNTIYIYDREIFDLIMDYREYQYLERIKRAGAVDFGEVIRLWKYLKQSAEYENHNSSVNIISNFQNDTEDSKPANLPDIPPASWQDVMHIIGSKLFSVKADLIFAFIFAVTFGLARRWTALIPIFAAAPAVILIVCALMVRKRSLHTEIFADMGAVCTLLALFWGVNLTMDNGIYTPGGTVMNLTTPEPGLKVTASRGEYMGLRHYPIVFFVDADNEADIKELFYRSDSGEFKSTGNTETGYINFRLTPEIKGDKVTIEIKYTDKEDKNHGPYKFVFDVAEERFKSGKNAVKNHPDILWLMPQRGSIVINSFMNDTVKAVHYGINTASPDKVYVPDFDEGYIGDGSYVVDVVKDDADFVSLYTEFSDGTSTDIHIKVNEEGRKKKAPAPVFDI